MGCYFVEFISFWSFDEVICFIRNNRLRYHRSRQEWMRTAESYTYLCLIIIYPVLLLSAALCNVLFCLVAVDLPDTADWFYVKSMEPVVRQPQCMYVSVKEARCRVSVCAHQHVQNVQPLCLCGCDFSDHAGPRICGRSLWVMQTCQTSGC